MEGLGPDKLSLGYLARKLAQAAPSVPQQYEQLGATSDNRGSLGYQHGDVGTTNPTQVVSSVLSTMFGPEAGVIGSLLTMMARGPLAQQGIDVTQPYESEYGGSADDAREAHRVSQELLLPQMAQSGQSVGRLAAGIDGMITQFSKGAIKPFVANLWNSIPGGDAGKGMFVSQIASAIPEIGDGLARLDPKLITNLKPLVDATYMRNGGKFNEADFRQLYGTFTQMRDQNQLGNVPAQVSIEAVPFAIKHIGPQATAQQIAGISQMAHQAQQSGLAPTYGTAMELLDSFGGLKDAANNPAGTMQYLGQLKQRILASGLDEASVYQMAQLAKQKGMPVRTMIEGQIGSTEAAKLFRDNPQQQAQMQNAAMETYGNLGHSDSMKALAVWSQKSPANKAWLAKATPAQINQVATQEMRNPANWRLMQSADTSGVSQLLSNSPGASSEMMLGEAQRFAKNTNNLELGRLLANKREMTRRLETQDYSGLSPRTIEALSPGGRFQGRLGASFLAAQANSAKPVAATADISPTPLPRIGLQYGAPASEPGMNGRPKPTPPSVLPKPLTPPNPLGAV